MYCEEDHCKEDVRVESDYGDGFCVEHAVLHRYEFEGLNKNLHLYALGRHVAQCILKELKEDENYVFNHLDAKGVLLKNRAKLAGATEGDIGNMIYSADCQSEAAADMELDEIPFFEEPVPENSMPSSPVERRSMTSP